MVVLNDGNYLQQAITIVLIFVRRPCTPVPSFVKKKKITTTKPNKKKKQTGSQAKGDDTWQGI